MLSPFPMRAAFPRSEYYGDSAPSRPRQPTTSLPAAAPDARSDGRNRDGSHVHCVPIDEGSAQLFPGSLATSTPQAFLVTSDADVALRHRSRLTANRFGAHCYPAHIHQIGAGSTLTGVQPLVHLRYAFPSR